MSKAHPCSRVVVPHKQKSRLNFPMFLFSDQDEVIEGIPLSQPFPMASACGTPEFTNFTVGFSGCLDYIYYQKDQLKVTQVSENICFNRINQRSCKF